MNNYKHLIVYIIIAIIIAYGLSKATFNVDVQVIDTQSVKELQLKQLNLEHRVRYLERKVLKKK